MSEPAAVPPSSSSTSGAATTTIPPTPGANTARGGIYAALRYTGIPESWIRRPRLPSRNWLIFLGVTSSVVGAYVYDRRKCREIREGYVRRVEHLAQVPMASSDLPRKVTVFAAKWPGDDDYSRGVRYFRKYVKPVLVAAAVDYEIVNGKRLGDVTRTIEDRIISKRRIAAGLENPTQSLIPLPSNLSPQQKEQRELQGGSIIVGRQTFKEYMEGLRRGWSGGLQVRDREEEVVRALDGDDVFDEPDDFDAPVGLVADGEPIPTASRLSPSTKAFSPLTTPYNVQQQQQQQQQPLSFPPNSKSPEDLPPPSSIPPQPPLLLVPFTNYLGFTQMPLMILDFFTQRHHVKAGAECAYSLIMGNTREIQHEGTSKLFEEPGPDDLTFDRACESFYKSSVGKLETTIEKERAGFYKELPKRLETARALARRTREPTKDEEKYPPPTEVDLRSERLKKELHWRSDLEGWQIVKPESEVTWDERFRGVLRIFDAPPEGSNESEAASS